MKFRGVVSLPLFVAPYPVPANVIADFGGSHPSFDRNSISPIIQSPLVNSGGPQYFNGIVPQPFDYGRFETRLGIASGGVSAFFDGDSVWQAQAIQGDGVTEVPALIKFYGAGVPSRLGFTGGLKADAIPNQLIDTTPNGFTDTGYYGPFYVHTQNDPTGCPVCWSPLGPAVLYNAYNYRYSCFAAVGQAPLLLTTWAANIGDIGLPFGASSEAIYFPSSVDYPGGRYFPWGGSVVPPIEPAGGSAVPISIDFDHHPALNGVPNDPNNFQAHIEYLLFMGPGGYIPGQNCTPIIVDTRNRHYYFVQFIPRTPRAVTALTDMSGGLPSWKQNPRTGVWFLTSAAPGLSDAVFHTQGLVLDYYPITLAPPPPFVLPCFNPCVPFTFKPGI